MCYTTVLLTRYKMKLSLNTEFSDILFKLKETTGHSINTLIYTAINDMNEKMKQQTLKVTNDQIQRYKPDKPIK